MNDSAPDRSHGRMPTDAQIDGLLRQFFRLEMPAELNQPFRRGALDGSTGPVLAVIPENAISAVPAQRNRRLTVASALVVLALSLVVFLQTRDHGSPTASPVTDTVTSPQSPLTPNEDLMLVSPGASSTDHKAVIGADGVTLEETDNIEVKPPRSAAPK